MLALLLALVPGAPIHPGFAHRNTAVAPPAVSAPHGRLGLTPAPTSEPVPTVVPSTNPIPARTTPPKPVPTPVPAPARGPLTWRPPVLVSPITLTLCNCNLYNGDIIVNLRVGQDYILKDPVVLTHSVIIHGGHNVVWIGGYVQPSSGSSPAIQMAQNAGAGGGIIHLEGIYVDGLHSVLYDGIEGGEYASMSKPRGTLADAMLQIENVRIDHLSGSSTVQHQDCIQHYGGWKDLRVDHFTCQSLYQGFELPYEDTSVAGVLSHWDIRNANLHDEPNSTGGGMQTLIHFGDTTNGTFTATSHQQRGNLTNVYLHATQRSFNSETYPNSGSQSLDGTVIHSTINANGTITWANTWAVFGFVTSGDPPGGDYVPRGVAGLGYVSPGYR